MKLSDAGNFNMDLVNDYFMPEMQNRLIIKYSSIILMVIISF